MLGSEPLNHCAGCASVTRSTYLCCHILCMVYTAAHCSNSAAYNKSTSSYNHACAQYKLSICLMIRFIAGLRQHLQQVFCCFPQSANNNKHTLTNQVCTQASRCRQLQDTPQMIVAILPLLMSGLQLGKRSLLFLSASQALLFLPRHLLQTHSKHKSCVKHARGKNTRRCDAAFPANDESEDCSVKALLYRLCSHQQVSV